MRKLLLLHGAGIASSRKKLTELKNRFDQNNVIVFGEESTLEDIKNNLAATPLFSTDRLVVLENPSEDFANYTLYPTSEGGASSPCTLILWFDHEIDSRRWTQGEILFFPESKEVSVFPFLDYLAAGDKKVFLELNKLKKAGFDIFYFITMIFYLLRSMVTIPKNVPPFVRTKLQKQQARFKKNISYTYKNILEIEFKIKSGLIAHEQAEFLIINEFLI